MNDVDENVDANSLQTIEIEQLVKYVGLINVDGMRGRISLSHRILQIIRAGKEG